MNRIIIVFFLVVLISCTRCSNFPEEPSPETLTVMSFNAENLFDSVKQGNEYPEYNPENGRWNDRNYTDKLLQVGRTIRDSVPEEKGPHIIAFQEIENKNVLNELTKGLLRESGYKYVIASDNRDSAVNTGFISRFPCAYTKYHTPYIAPYGSMRTIIEAAFDIGGQQLIIFNNHWKSKIGEESELQRKASAHTLITRIKAIMKENPEAEILILGDFNENADEYLRDGKSETKAIMTEDSGEADSFLPLVVTGNCRNDNGNRFFSPWLRDGNTEEGSYFYKNRWETIDNFFLGSKLTDEKGFVFSKFRTVRTGWNTDRDEKPLSFNRKTAEGCSDHLPILLELDIRDR